MAKFSILPNELVSGIWGNIHEPKDVESFALVSKGIYAVGRPFVEEHNRLKREFSFIDLNYPDRTSTPAFLFKEVLCQPRIALYVVHLSIDSFLHSWQRTRDDDDDDDDDDSDYNPHVPYHPPVPYPNHSTELFIDTIRKSSFVPSQEVSHWIECVEAGYDDPIVAILLMLLSNLHMVTIKDDEVIGECLKKTLERIARAEKTRFLTRLVTVNLLFEDWPDQMKLTCLKTFAALPLVQSLHLDQMSIEKADNVIEEEQYFVGDTFNITEITFTNSVIHQKILFQLLESTTGLKAFSYVDPYVDPNDMHYIFKPFWIRTALLAYSKHTLEYLKILPLRRHNPLGTLRGFTALKELETSIYLLGYWPKIVTFADLLPASIEKLHLHTRFLMSDGQITKLQLVEELTAKSKFPNLKVLKFEPKMSMVDLPRDRSLIEPLVEKCRNAGIELTFKNVMWSTG